MIEGLIIIIGAGAGLGYMWLRHRIGGPILPAIAGILYRKYPNG